MNDIGVLGTLDPFDILAPVFVRLNVNAPVR